MPLPLFDDPPAPTRTGAWPGSATYFAFSRGFKEGVQDHAASLHYDADEEVDRYFKDGHRIGRLFRPLPCMKEKR